MRNKNGQGLEFIALAIKKAITSEMTIRGQATTETLEGTWV
jgi:hypothetical protein